LVLPRRLSAVCDSGLLSSLLLSLLGSKLTSLDFGISITSPREGFANVLGGAELFVLINSTELLSLLTKLAFQLDIRLDYVFELGILELRAPQSCRLRVVQRELGSRGSELRLVYRKWVES